MNAVDAQVDRYLAQVAAALADLPADAREELLEDLPAHFAEVLAEDNGALEERLGPPVAYAAELRAAAGFDRPGAARRFDLRDTELVRWLRLADVKVGKLLGYERSRDFLALLRPAWWVVRGWAVGMLLLGVTSGDPGPLPDVGGHALVGWLFVLPFVVVSVRLGPILPRLPEPARPLMGVLGAALAFLILVNVLTYDDKYHVQWSPSSTYDRYGHIVDVFPVDKDGKPLTDVRLFDQDGNPIMLGRWHDCPAALQVGRSENTYPLCHPHARPTATATPDPSVSPSANPSPSGTR
jgi:hypothetical protein